MGTDELSDGTFLCSRTNQSLGRRLVLLENCLILVSCLAYSSTLKIEATGSSEISVDFQRTTQSYIPQDRNHSNSYLGVDPLFPNY
jgi:hypothetical protein